MRDFASPEESRVIVGGMLAALTFKDKKPTELQHTLITGIARAFYPDFPNSWDIDPIPAEELRDLLPYARRRALGTYSVGLALMEHPLRPDVEAHLERYITTLGLDGRFLEICKDTADERMVALHADLIRNSWYTEMTVEGALHGKLLRLMRSKLAYYGVGRAPKVARRWGGLRQCPEGSWGRAVADFYEVHDFPFPGEAHGIYEVGAQHDWIHVLCDYSTQPEGEIDVFAFIAATMQDPKGFVQFAFTLALFQNGTVETVGGKKVLIARSDTLSDPGATDRLADAVWRAFQCDTDVMAGIDHFAHKDEPLDELRERWSIVPKRVPGPGWTE